MARPEWVTYSDEEIEEMLATARGVNIRKLKRL